MVDVEAVRYRLFSIGLSNLIHDDTHALGDQDGVNGRPIDLVKVRQRRHSRHSRMASSVAYDGPSAVLDEAA